MCLITFAYKVHPEYDLILLANRDEFRNRAFNSAHRWGEFQQVISGIDLTANGTWTGITASGKIAVITNFRQGLNLDPELSSRGELATNFLDSALSPKEYLDILRNSKDKYNGYNILFGNKDEIIWYSNTNDAPTTINPGIYGLSNCLLDTPWPKVSQVKKQLAEKLEVNQIGPSELMPVMLNKQQFPESSLPDTGIDTDLELGLSPVFVDLDSYGTVLTTLIYFGKQEYSLIEYNHLNPNHTLSSCHSSRLYTFDAQS